jgi:hypothetical protein
MARFFARIGGLAIVAAFLYLAIWEALRGGADNAVFREILAAGGASLGLGFVLWVAGRGMAGFISRSCPRCGRRVARGKVYCENHLQETINEYRDRQRGKNG